MRASLSRATSVALLSLVTCLGLQSKLLAEGLPKETTVSLRITTTEKELIASGTLKSTSSPDESSDLSRVEGADGRRALVSTEWTTSKGVGKFRFQDEASGWWLEDSCESIVLGDQQPKGIEDYLRLRSEKKIFERDVLRTSDGFELVWEESEETADEDPYDAFRAMIAAAQPIEIGAVPASARRTAGWASQMLTGRRDGNFVVLLPKFLGLVSALGERADGRAPAVAAAESGSSQ